VEQEGKVDGCSKTSTLTQWCEHEGDATFYNGETDDAWDRSTTESIVIPDNVGGTFLFQIDHDIPTNPGYYQGGEDIAGSVHLWIGDDLTEYGHVIKGTFHETFFLSVTCDVMCGCEVEHFADVECVLNGKVNFPGKSQVLVNGQHADNMIVQKAGKQLMCDYYSRTPAWGCVHGGDAFVFKTEDEFERGNEDVIIEDASDGSFRFKLSHYFTDEENNPDFPLDHTLLGQMSIWVNDKKKRKYSHPDNSMTDTHLGTGEENPLFMGTTYVDVGCNSRCQCSMTQYNPTCEIRAELSFPDFATAYYGYNAETLTVTNAVDGTECSYYDPLSSWGCMHTGDAYIREAAGDSDAVSDVATVYMPDASNLDLTFTAKYYSSSFNLVDYNPTTHASTLNININGSEHILRHVRENEDYDIADYTSEQSWRVVCDEACNCDLNPGVM